MGRLFYTKGETPRERWMRIRFPLRQQPPKSSALREEWKESQNNLGFTDEDLENIMEQNRKELNMQMPSFAKVSRIKLHDQEFEKTAKKSIKRYLYQNAI